MHCSGPPCSMGLFFAPRPIADCHSPLLIGLSRVQSAPKTPFSLVSVSAKERSPVEGITARYYIPFPSGLGASCIGAVEVGLISGEELFGLPYRALMKPGSCAPLDTRGRSATRWIAGVARLQSHAQCPPRVRLRVEVELVLTGRSTLACGNVECDRLGGSALLLA